MKKERKSFIINTSKEYSIVSQFTSFVAIEEREKVEGGGGGREGGREKEEGGKEREGGKEGGRGR